MSSKKVWGMLLVCSSFLPMVLFDNWHFNGPELIRGIMWGAGFVLFLQGIAPIYRELFGDE